MPGAIQKFIQSHEEKIYRLLELLPGLVSWSLILFPFIGSFFAPTAVAFFIIVYDVYWLYHSAVIGVGAVISHRRIVKTKREDWLAKAQELPNWEKVHHIIIIPTFKEPRHTLRRTLKSLRKQTFPKEKVTVVLAIEQREEDGSRRVEALEKEFRGEFGNFFITTHPEIPGEVKGKSSNTAWAAKTVKKELIDKQGLDINWVTITSEDADACLHPQYFSYLTYEFLKNPNRHRRFWQAAILFYNNIWRIPAPIRVVSTFGSVMSIAQLVRQDRLINYSTYSTSLKMIDQVGYWDTDVIPEDWRIFFKSFFALGGKVEVEPIFLPIFADAAESTGFWKTMVNQYEQVKRWAWGVSDDPYVIIRYLTTPGVSFWDKTIRTLKMLQDHFLWPVHWFVVTLGINIPVLLNKEFSQTLLGYRAAQLSTLIMTYCLVFLATIIIVDLRQRPKRPPDVSRLRAWLTPLEFLLMPIVGFFFTALPAIEAHTRLMLGKKIEYRATEKV